MAPTPHLTLPATLGLAGAVPFPAVAVPLEDVDAVAVNSEVSPRSPEELVVTAVAVVPLAILLPVPTSPVGFDSLCVVGGGVV